MAASVDFKLEIPSKKHMKPDFSKVPHRLS